MLQGLLVVVEAACHERTKIRMVVCFLFVTVPWQSQDAPEDRYKLAFEMLNAVNNGFVSLARCSMNDSCFMVPASGSVVTVPFM